MGKIIFTLLVLSSMIFAQSGKNSASQNQVDTTNARLSRIESKVSNLQSSNTITNASFSAGTTAAVLSETSIPIKWMEIYNNTPGSVLYIGNSTVSTSNGFACIKYGDSYLMDRRIDNLNKIFVISTQANTDIRIIYGN